MRLSHQCINASITINHHMNHYQPIRDAHEGDARPTGPVLGPLASGWQLNVEKLNPPSDSHIDLIRRIVMFLSFPAFKLFTNNATSAITLMMTHQHHVSETRINHARLACQ